MPGSDDALLAQLAALDAEDAGYASQFVDQLLLAARNRGASDLHLLPTPAGLEIAWRCDGVLRPLGVFSPGKLSHVITRLKVMAELLTYRTDVPQEGRIRAEPGVEMRVSTLPTLHGEKAVVRFFQSGERFQRVADLGLPEDIQEALLDLLGETSGAILVTGPAGSGKTTTLYACLRELATRTSGGRSIVTLEDPIEVPLPGITQSQPSMGTEFDMAGGLRAIVRQDPEVIMVGEIRDQATAQVALQASLTGQLLLSSFHAPSAAGAISRLLDMGIEPYVLRSGLLAIVCQRLVRKVCSCRQPGADVNATADCARCGGTGLHGRMVLAEMLCLNDRSLREAVLAREDAAALESLAVEAGMVPLESRAQAAVSAGLTTAAEIRRVMGNR